MRLFTGSLLIILSLIIIPGCKGTGKKDLKTGNDTITIPDTGFTGIRQYFGNKLLIKETTFKNGVREGLMKTYYRDGRLYQTFWYENNVREDSSCWYFPEGGVFRTTPFKKDTIDGIQKQFYRNGKIKAKLGYKKGFRTPYFEEFTQDGKLVGGYPEIVVKINDEYKSKGIYRIGLELSDNSTKVTFYRGEFENSVFDTSGYAKINTIKGKGSLTLKKTGSPKGGYIGVISEFITTFGNKYLTYKKIELPYNDLN